jgi:choline dehydrogenase-like flavoprotein
MEDRVWSEDEDNARYDAIVIGSGFGGAMAAHVLVESGWSVLMLERGDWVPRGPDNWAADAVGEMSPHYSKESLCRVMTESGERPVGAFHCVGGPSVFYGGVALRFRAEDFESNPEIAGNSGARWPWSYRELEPYYTEAERILGVAGDAGIDPTEPARTAPYLEKPAELAPVSRRIERAASGLGYRPFRLPLAINRQVSPGRGACIGCGTCDGFACAIAAKNDLATSVLAPLVKRGLRLRVNAAVSRLHVEGKRITGVEVRRRDTNQTSLYRADVVVLAAGALGTPQLLLASGLQRHNPGGHVIGRYLMRHYNKIVLGIFPQPPNPGGGFHKQLAIHDFYFGDSTLRYPRGKLGGIQQLATPPAGLVRAQLPPVIGSACARWVHHLTGLLTIAEDQPQYENRVLLDSRTTDVVGLPRLQISHRYSERDRAAGHALVERASGILRRAGAWALCWHRVDTFSHAVGTVRVGTDPRTSALDPECSFRGLQNLYVVDGSVMPTSAAVNPSLTIAANALRAAHRLAGHSYPIQEEGSYATRSG